MLREKLAVGRIGAPKGVHGDLKITSYSGSFEHFKDLEVLELAPPEDPAQGGAAEALSAESAHSGAARVSAPVPHGAAPVPHGAAMTMAAASAGAASAGAAAGGRSLRLKVLRSQMDGGQLLLAFAGYESPEKARVLTGMDIIMPRAGAAPLGKNEWYRSDLIGLELRAPAGVLSAADGALPLHGAPGAAAMGPEAAVSCASGRDGAKGPVLATVTATVEGGPDICLEAGLPGGGRALVPFRKEFIGEVHLEEGWIELLAPWILG